VRFAVDGMLGKLARWLRIAGHDTIYARDLKVEPDKEDETLLQLVARQRRVLLTADKNLYTRALGFGLKTVLITKKDVVDQLLEISKALGRRVKLDFEKSRCPVCNGTLIQVDLSEVSEDLRKKNKDFWKCSSCGKVYWEGKHWRSIIKTAERYEREVGKSLPRRR